MDLLALVEETEQTTDGSLPVGFLFASVKNVGGTVAQVNGVALPPGEAKSYPFVGKGYPSISYEVNSTTLRIMIIV